MFRKGASELIVLRSREEMGLSIDCELRRSWGQPGAHTSPETEERVVLKFDKVMGFKARGVGCTAAGAAFAPEFKKLWGKSKR